MTTTVLSVGLAFQSMVDEAILSKRLGFWLRVARERAGKSQEGAALELGLKPSSKSTISDWENGVRPPSLPQLRRLARYYNVPINVFVEPGPTAEEDLDRLVELAASSIDAERDDWEAGQARDPDAGAGPDAQLGTRSA